VHPVPWRRLLARRRSPRRCQFLEQLHCRVQHGQIPASPSVFHLDLDAKTATVAGKGGIPRAINWYTHTAHLLARLCSGRDSGPVFLASRRPRHPVATADRDPATGRARLSYRRAAECFTGTTGWTLHQLRHTRIRELKDQGCPLPVLQKITGHRSLRTLTEHYPGPSPEAVRAWYDESDPAARRRRGASG
jgi:integrase